MTVIDEMHYYAKASVQLNDTIVIIEIVLVQNPEIDTTTRVRWVIVVAVVSCTCCAFGNTIPFH